MIHRTHEVPSAEPYLTPLLELGDRSSSTTAAASTASAAAPALQRRRGANKCQHAGDCTTEMIRRRERREERSRAGGSLGGAYCALARRTIIMCLKPSSSAFSFSSTCFSIILADFSMIETK